MDQDLVQKSTDDLLKLQEESRAELFALRFQIALGNVEKPHRIKLLKKRIARILTIIAQRQAAGEAVKRDLGKTDQKEQFKQALTKMNADFKAFQAKKVADLEAQQAQTEPTGLSNLEELDFEGFEEIEPATVTSEVKDNVTAAKPTHEVANEPVSTTEPIKNKTDQKGTK